MAKKEQRKQNVFPDGTPISEWFLQTKVVHPDSLGKKYDLSDYGIESNPHIVQTQKIQKIIDEAAANVNPEKPDVPLNKNDAFQKVQKRRVQEKR